MNDTYISLFSEMAQTSTVLAEQVMEYDKAKDDENGEKTARIMRDDYQQLYEKIKDNFDNLTHNDYAKLLVSALVIINNLSQKIDAYNKTIHSYKLEIIPKLQRILDECKTEEEVQHLAAELFIKK